MTRIPDPTNPADQPQPRDGVRYGAAVDIGTNSVRLLIGYLDDSGQLVIAERQISTTRLGQGVDAYGALAEAAIQRTCTVLTDYGQRWGAYGIHPDQVVIMATSAVRDAQNAEVFQRRAHAACGVWPQVISGQEEARIGFLGACADQPDGPALVIDIGGGSTEFIAGQVPDQIHAALSLQIGCVRLEERHGPPPYTPDQVERARVEIRDLIAPAVTHLSPHLEAGTRLLGVAGTVTTLAALDLDLPFYDPNRVHGYGLSRQRLAYWIDQLIVQDPQAIEARGPVEPNRGDVLPLGAMILDEIMAAFALDTVIASEHDSLDGMAHTVLTRDPVG